MNLFTAILLAFLRSPANPDPIAPGAALAERAPGVSRSAVSDSASGALGNHDTTRSKEPRPTAETNQDQAHKRIVVVVSKKNPIKSVTAAELGRIFLRQQTQWPNGWAITVFVRPMKAAIRQRFSQSILHRKPEALREYWLNLKLTRGFKPPKVLRSAKLVLRYLERVKGGIAYLYEDEVDETVRIVKVTEK